MFNQQILLKNKKIITMGIFFVKETFCYLSHQYECFLNPLDLCTVSYIHYMSQISDLKLKGSSCCAKFIYYILILLYYIINV